jgi:competence ComEA-like helix-hairpin-helix protein|tara:strand:+ start:2238 stop:2816 length:579 start_codon:yes stop_codon:yes gene_type:complete
MNKLKLFLVLLLVISIPNVYSLCEENQININTATKEGLDTLKGIGPVKSDAIMDARPFNSVDELINVKGIGEVTLNNIKEQGLACVNDEETEDIMEDDENEEQTLEEISEEEPIKEEIIEEVIPPTENINVENNDFNIKTSIIKLTPKTIKSEENIETSNKNNYAIYGFVVFCILLISLFLLKRKKFKNEFN